MTGEIKIVSVAADGTQGDRNVDTKSPGVSADGRYVAFFSPATNLLPGLTNASNSDVYLKDMQTGDLFQVSVPASGSGESATTYLISNPIVSDSGRYVYFSMRSTNMDSPSVTTTQVWRRDMQTNTTLRVSTKSDGTGGTENDTFDPSVAEDEITIAFASGVADMAPGGISGTTGCFIKNTQNNTVYFAFNTAGGSAGDDNCNSPMISGDGKSLVFSSAATTFFAAADGTYQQVYHKNLTSGVLTLVSTSAADVLADGSSYGPSVSNDGRYVAFSSYATNLVGSLSSAARVYVKDMLTGSIVIASSDAGNALVTGDAFSSYIVDGTKALFYTVGALVTDDTNTKVDVYVKTLPW